MSFSNIMSFLTDLVVNIVEHGCQKERENFIGNLLDLRKAFDCPFHEFVLYKLNVLSIGLSVL